MKENWNLDALYSSFKCSKIKEDMKEFETEISNINMCNDSKLTCDSNAAKITKMEDYIKRTNNVSELGAKLHQYAHLTLATDVNNKEAFELAEKVENLNNNLIIADVKFRRWINTISNIEELINKSTLLKEHKYYIEEIQRKGTHTLSPEEEFIISKMKNTGSKTFENLYSRLVSNLMVDIKEGGVVNQFPLNYVKNMEFSEDGIKRKAAYEAQNIAYGKIEEGVAACLNGIKGEVITLSKLREYESPLNQTVEESRMEMSTLKIMLEVVQDNLSYFHKFYRKKAKILGYNKALPFYDIFAPVSSNSRKFSYEEAQKIVVSNFRTFSDDLADYAKLAFQDNWMDIKPKQGKRGGAFCSTIHPIRQSRILCNYSGSFKSVITLAHELGHAYHGKCLFNETNLNSHYAAPVAETASIFAETIVKTSALNVAKQSGNKQEYLSILESDLTGAAQVIVDIYSRYLFEDEVFKRRDNGMLSVEELKEVMARSQKMAFGDSIDTNYLQPYAWIYKPHYYYTERNYYNYPYAFGILFAKGLYCQYVQEGTSFTEKYVKLLSNTGKMSINEMAASIGIDINSKKFWQKSMDMIKDEIDVFLKL